MLAQTRRPCCKTSGWPGRIADQGLIAIAAALRDYGDVRVRSVGDPAYAVCAGALKLAMELPPRYWEQLGGVTVTDRRRITRRQRDDLAAFGGGHGRANEELLIMGTIFLLPRVVRDGR